MREHRIWAASGLALAAGARGLADDTLREAKGGRSTEFREAEGILRALAQEGGPVLYMVADAVTCMGRIGKRAHNVEKMISQE
jgi:hypothetical protein